MAHQGQSSVLNENVLGNDRELFNLSAVVFWTDSSSFLVRPPSRFVFDDKPLSRPDASAIGRHWSQHGWCASDVSVIDAPEAAEHIDLG